ncbi:hypothetical protein L1987_40248 [Smallanthus sonchifolius]|uniref:Uncharacterized protein n=1 Tax=Smallanthus sonchifolius TaxID=185202 RepID=A0ACB9GSP1_9ASTR|nr:hypothetical protein L1987_40248 [Smallanthus sonchifolius]
MFGAVVMSIRRAGMFASLILMMFLLTGGYYVQAVTEFAIIRYRELKRRVERSLDAARNGSGVSFVGLHLSS